MVIVGDGSHSRRLEVLSGGFQGSKGTMLAASAPQMMEPFLVGALEHGWIMTFPSYWEVRNPN